MAINVNIFFLNLKEKIVLRILNEKLSIDVSRKIN